MSFDESKHPRVKAGEGPHGGEFASKAEGQAAYDIEGVRSTFEPGEEEAISKWSDSEGDDHYIRNNPESLRGQRFSSALDKIPPHTGILYRGSDERSAAKFEGVKPGDHLVLDKFRSWSRDQNVAMDFSGEADSLEEAAKYTPGFDKPGVLFRIRTNRSQKFKDITPFMVEEHQYGQEVVSDRGTVLRVISVQKNVRNSFLRTNPFFENHGTPAVRTVHIITVEEVG